MEELAKKTTSKTTSDISEDKHEVKKGLSLKEIETEVGINFGVIVAKIKSKFGKNNSDSKKCCIFANRYTFRI